MARSELALAIEQVCEEKNIPYESVIESIEAALSVAYRKEVGNKMLNVRADFNPEDGSAEFYDIKTVVEDPTEEELEELAKREAEKAERRERRDMPRKDEKKEEKTEESEEEEEKKYNPKTDIGITDAKEVEPGAELGDEIVTELPIPDDFGRVAAQTAKQVIIQKLREAERETVFNVYKDRVGEIVNASVHRVEGPVVYMDLGQATAIMPPSQQIRDEQYGIGSRYKVYLMSVEQGRRGPEIIASRSAAEMVERLFEMEVPEIQSGVLEVKAVAREAGSRSKIAVWTTEDSIDPIGSCVGQRGARVQTVMTELGGEKIDIIEWSDDVVRFIVNALSPAKIISVQLNPEEEQAIAYVAEDQLSLAIGKGGQNVRLAAKLTGWKIDVVKDGEEPEDRDATEKVEDTTDEAPVEMTEEVVEAPVEEVPEDTTDEIVEEAVEEIAEDASEQTTEEITDEADTDTTKEESAE